MDSLLCFKVELRDLCPFVGLKGGEMDSLLCFGVELRDLCPFMGLNGGEMDSLLCFGVKLSAKCICVSFWVANRGKMGSLVLILGVK